MYTVLFSVLFLLVGLTIGWMVNEKYLTITEVNRHEYEDLFQKNPHPEIFDSNGDVDRGDYYTLFIDPAYFEQFSEDLFDEDM